MNFILTLPDPPAAADTSFPAASLLPGFKAHPDSTDERRSKARTALFTLRHKNFGSFISILLLTCFMLTAIYNTLYNNSKIK
jgi:hypothetical protein